MFICDILSPIKDFFETFNKKVIDQANKFDKNFTKEHERALF